MIHFRSERLIYLFLIKFIFILTFLYIIFFFFPSGVGLNTRISSVKCDHHIFHFRMCGPWNSSINISDLTICCSIGLAISSKKCTCLFSSAYSNRNSWRYVLKFKIDLSSKENWFKTLYKRINKFLDLIWWTF